MITTFRAIVGLAVLAGVLCSCVGQSGRASVDDEAGGPVVDLEHERALDAQEDAARLGQGAEYWKKRSEGAQARAFMFRVVDQQGHPASGIPLRLSTMQRNAGWPVLTNRPTTITDQDGITDAQGILKLQSPVGHRFTTIMRSKRWHDDAWAVEDESVVENRFVVESGQTPEQANIPAVRRPAGIDYEFHIIRYPSQAPVAYWESQLLMTPDGTPQPWNPLATVRLPPKTDDNRQEVVVPGDWPAEFVVTLWRDPGARMMYLHERKVPSGEVFQIPMMAKVHWKLTIQARRGGLLAAPWRAQQGDHRDLFPVFDTLSDEGYLPELSWDVDEPTGVTPLIWDKPIALYWRRETNPVRLVQITLTPMCERILRRTGKPLSPDPEVTDFRFSLLATFRLRPDGERQIVLPTDAMPTVDGKRDDSDRPQPSWYRWAIRDQLAGWLAEPVLAPAMP